MGGRGDLGSADSLQVGVTLGYPSGLAGPLDSEVASVTDALTIADATAISTTGSNKRLISRQPPTVADTTAAAFQSPTHVRHFAATAFLCCGSSVQRVMRFFYMADVNNFLSLN